MKAKIRNIFVVFFLLTGGVQSIMAVIFDFENSSSFLGFTAFFKASSKPDFMDYNILLISVIVWAFVFSLTYLITIYALSLQSLPNNVRNLKEEFHIRGDKLFRDNLILFLSVVFLPLNFAKLVGGDYLFSGFFNTSYFLIFPISVFLILGAIYSPTRKSKVLYIIFFIFTILFILVYSYISVRRSTLVYLVFAFFFTYYIFSENIKFPRLILIFSPFAAILVFFTIYKYYSGAVNNEGSIIDFFYSTTGQFENIFLYLSFTWLGRLNNMSAIYWYLYDMQHYSSSVFIDVDFTFLAVLSNILVFLSSSLNSNRYINGNVLEVYLFGEATGGNYEGGFAIPPVVEALWSTNSYVVSFFVLSFFIIFIIFPFFFFKKKAFFPIVFVCFLYPIFLNPESIISVAKLSYRSVIFSAIYFYLLFRGVIFKR